MLKVLITILLFSILLVSFACQKSGSSSSSGSSSFLGDDTAEAVKFIDQANGDLREIKKIYIANQDKIDELSSAMNDKEAEKVKTIADALVTEINKGLILGGSAIEKIEKAKNLDVNSTFKEYLSMKSESLRLQLEAFGFRLEAAQVLRDGFGGKDLQAIDKAKVILTEKETEFKKLMEEGRSKSQEANEFAVENSKKKQ